MRHILFAIVAALTVSFASPGQAARGAAFWGSGEELDFVAEINDPSGSVGNGLALCHLVWKTHIFFLPLYFSSQSYALASDRCDTDYYYDISPAQIAELKDAGVLSADIPDEPQLTMAQAATPFVWGGVVVIVLIMKFQAGGFSRSTGPGTAAGQFRNRVLETACRAALADGKIDDREVGTICAIAGQFTTNQVSPDQMRKMIGYVRVQPETSDLSHLGSGLDDVERHQLMRVAMMVIGRENMGDSAAKSFLDKLAMGLLIDPKRREAMAVAI